MTRLELLLTAVTVLLVAWMLAAAPVYPSPAAGGVIDPCVVWWTPETGVVEICPYRVYLPAVPNCGECLSAWPATPSTPGR